MQSILIKAVAHLQKNCARATGLCPECGVRGGEVLFVEQVINVKAELQFFG